MSVQSGFPQKCENKIPWLFPDFQWNFPDHFIDNWLSSYIVCKYIRRISVFEITICIVFNAADVTLENNEKYKNFFKIHMCTFILVNTVTNIVDNRQD